MATLLFLDGFEHGLVTSGTGGIYSSVGGSPAIVTTPVRTGSRALEISASGAAENVNYTVANTIVCLSVYIRFATLPTAAVTILHLTNASGNGVLNYNNSTGTFQTQISGNTPVTVSGTIAVDTWYLVDFEFDCSTGTAALIAKTDGANENTNTRSQASANITAVRCGTAGADTYTAYYDDWLISVTDGDYPLGAHSIERLLPSADGTHNTVGANEIEYSATGTDITDSSTDVNTLIDDAPLDTAVTDYINDVGTDATAYVEVTFGNVSDNSLPVIGVRGYQVDRESTNTGASSAHSDVHLSDGTAVTPGLRLAADDPGVTVTTRKKLLDAPTGGWDGTKVDGLKARLGYGDGAPDVWFASLMLEVALGVSSGTTVQVTAGSLTFAGQTVALVRTTAVTAGSLTFAGQTVTTSIATVVPVTAGSLSFAGQAVGANQTVVVSAGSLALTGQTVVPTLSVSVTPGSVTWSGQTVTTTTSAPVTAGSLVWTGQTVIVDAGGGVTVPVTAGALTFAGQTVNVNVPVVVPVTAGSLAWSGQSVGVFTVTPVVPGQVAFQGQAVALSYRYVIEPGQLVFAGQTVTPIDSGANLGSPVRGPTRATLIGASSVVTHGPNRTTHVGSNAVEEG